MNIARMLSENVHKFGEYEQLVFIGDNDRAVLTNREIEKRADALAAALGSLGVGQGDVVAVCVGNIPQIPELMNGIMRLGATFLPIIFALTPSEIRYILEDSGALIVITEQRFLPKVKEAVETGDISIKVIVIGGGGGLDNIAYDEFLETSNQITDVIGTEDDAVALLMYTSGTTGVPKGVMLTHGNLISNMMGGAHVWPMGHGDRVILCVPMNHIYGVLFYHESCAFGTSIVLIPSFDAEKVLELITELRVTVAPLVPTMITMMMEKYSPHKHSLKSIKYMISAGAPLAQETWRKARELFDLELFHGYGLTEAAPTVARQSPGRTFKYGSVGPPIPGLDVRIVDSDGNGLSDGEEGEIICKGPGIMKGYLNKPQETADAIKDGWLFTGDLGRLDEEGELYVTGRKKDLIIKGGENIDPGISENWLYKHPAVLEAAVVAIPDNKYGEEVAAAVALRPDQKASEEDLLKYVRDHVHHFFAPKRIFFMKTLPKTSTGKILKREIRKTIMKEETPWED